MSIANRPPLGVLRQLSRAAFADRLLGDELMRLTMARVALDPASSSASVDDLAAAFIQSWRAASKGGRGASVPFSNASLAGALPPPPDDARLLLLLVDVLGFTPQEGGRILGVRAPLPMLRDARDALSVRNGAKAVIIEDDPLIAADLKAIVEELGVTVVGLARSAQEAITEITSARPEIVLADYNLEGRATGLDAIEAMQGEHDCPVVFITGYPDRVLQGDEVEPDFVISKPYTPENVRAAVVHCLDARRA